MIHPLGLVQPFCSRTAGYLNLGCHRSQRLSCSCAPLIQIIFPILLAPHLTITQKGGSPMSQFLCLVRLGQRGRWRRCVDAGRSHGKQAEGSTERPWKPSFPHHQSPAAGWAGALLMLCLVQFLSSAVCHP